MIFPTSIEHIQKRINSIDPVSYGRSRNFVSGAVTYLSPYISRGVISTKQVLQYTLKRGFNPVDIEKFIMELAWRDYWQLNWLSKKELINSDLRHAQKPVSHYEIPRAIIEADTGIIAVDNAIKEFYKTGYLHNHIRMYIASIACNLGESHWYKPAQWMYFHLLDGDWASNTLSWQWVVGTNSNKKYFANQENINKYTESYQAGTFLDVPYSGFPLMEIPDSLREITDVALETKLPSLRTLNIDRRLPTLVYNSYNIDPYWRLEIDANRVLLLEPDHFKKYPKSNFFIEFILGLSSNIQGLKVFVGSFQELKSMTGSNSIYYKEHPFNTHYQGIEDPRDWMFSVVGEFSSFFSFWKRCKKELKHRTAQTYLFDEKATPSN